MSILASLVTDDSIANEKDTVGGGGNRILDSGLYNCTVETAYISKAASGALGLVVNFKTDDGRSLRQTFWMTSGSAKGCKNYYEKDGEKYYLPGFILANSLSLLTTGQEISQLETEKKVIPLYNPEAKAEVPTKVDMVMDMLGKEILVGVLKTIVDKTKKNEATGIYEPTGETREENEVDKFFRARDKMTTAEIRAQAPEANFYKVWSEKWTGKVREKAKGAGQAVGGVANANAGNLGLPKTAAAGGVKRPTTSLFA